MSVDDQRKALDALAITLRPSELTVPKPILDLIPPRPPGWGLHRELFARTTGDTFDPLSPATIASDVTIGFLLQFDRAARMVGQHAVNPQRNIVRTNCSTRQVRVAPRPTSSIVMSCYDPLFPARP